ncbi:hypothetical protein JW916_16535 [Candidatus Sumerlaeota bacterium]|nr:hypothetical protein [Candidatus Sumerlaeota bacterium]
MPTDLKGLFDFWDGYVKILYCEHQTWNEVATEVLFEVQAAFDHVSRIWVYGENEADVVSKAYSHLKRACLDIFKLKLRVTLDLFDELKSTPIDLIESGRFESRLNKLVAEIREKSIEARRREGRPDHDDGLAEAFELWTEVYGLCDTLEKKYYLNSDIEWAERKSSRAKWRDRAYAFIVGGVLVGLCQNFLTERLWLWLKGLFVSPRP